MKNTLIIGNVGVGKTTKLKELLNEVPKNVHIMLCERYKEGIRHHETISLQESEIRNKQDIDADLSRLLIQSPSLLVIDEIHFYKNLSVPLGVPIYATMEALSKEDAQQILNNQNIDVAFERVILLKWKYGTRTVTLLE